MHIQTDINFIYGLFFFDSTMKKTIFAIFMLIVLIIAATGCIKLDYDNKPEEVPIKSTEVYEITEVDVLSMIDDIDSRNIMVMGIKLGDPMENVFTAVGTPDIETQVGPNSYNYEYRERLLVEHVALLFHSDNGTITRITFRPSFNRYLKGETVIQDHSKEDVYRIFGKPDILEPVSYFTIYYFYEKGFEVVVEKKEMGGFSLVPPKPGIRDEKLVVS